MRRLLALTMCAVSLGAAAQSTITYPYNPDEDGNGLIAVGDLQGILANYGLTFVPTEIQIDGDALSTVLNELLATQIELQQTITQQQQYINQLQQYISIDEQTVLISGANLQVVSGEGSSYAPVNGAGNIIIGYNEDNGDDKTGSHNLVVGEGHSYTSFGGIVLGYNNNILGACSSVTGGYGNTASGVYSSISGGYVNTAAGSYSSVSGGYQNVSAGSTSSVAGGRSNTAYETHSSVAGGAYNAAIEGEMAVSGDIAYQQWVESQGYLTEETDPVASSAGYLTTETDPIAMQAMPTHLTDLYNWVDEDNDGWNDHQYATTEDVLNIARDYQYSNYFAPNNRTFADQNFHEMNWSGANLEGYTFVNSYLRNSNFTYAWMPGVTFENTNLYHCDFEGAVLTNSTWINSFPSFGGLDDNCQATFENANLTGADFSEVTWSPGWNTFNDANLDGATIPDFWDGGWYGQPSVMPDGWYIEELECVSGPADECLFSVQCYNIGNWPLVWRKAQ